MKRYTAIILFALAAILFFAKSGLADGVRHVSRVDSVPAHSTFVPTRVEVKENTMRGQRLASSTFPVRMQVRGSALCVTSNYSQLLPIYTRGGTFYMAMRLNKGMNWLNGLPKGRYLINNQQISIP